MFRVCMLLRLRSFAWVADFGLCFAVVYCVGMMQKFVVLVCFAICCFKLFWGCAPLVIYFGFGNCCVFVV